MLTEPISHHENAIVRFEVALGAMVIAVYLSPFFLPIRKFERYPTLFKNEREVRSDPNPLTPLQHNILLNSSGAALRRVY